MPRMKTDNQFKKELDNAFNGRIISLEKYKGALTAIIVKCNVCDKQHKAHPTNLLRGHFGCSCSEKLRAPTRYKKSNKQFKFELKEMFDGRIILLEKYKLGKLPILAKCTVCNTEKRVLSSDLVYGSFGCKCSEKARIKKISQTLMDSDKQIQDKINKINDKIILLGRNKDNYLKGDFTCIKCGHKWTTQLSSVVFTASCKNCSKYKVKPFKLGNKTVYIQGYEPQALRWLKHNTNLKPSQIIAGEMGKIPRIDYYYDNKWRFYYPDFYIPKKKIIVEVKSTWTLLMNEWVFNSIKAKREAVKEEQYKFSLMLMNDSEKIKLNKWYKMDYSEACESVNILIAA